MTGSSPPDDTIRLLHVDDNPEIGEITASFLAEENDRFQIETATDASEGLERLSERQFECVISDYDMPEQNGIEFLEAVREWFPDLPFILFTGKGSEEIASDAISAGVSDYLQKETGTDQYTVLANRIENLVSQRRAESNLERRAHQQEVVAELGRAALAGDDLEVLFDSAVAVVAEALDNEYAKVLEFVPEADELLIQSGVGWRDEQVGELRMDVNTDLQAAYTLQTEQPVIVNDFSNEARFRKSEILIEHGVSSGICVMIGEPDDPWGVFATHATDRKRFSEHDVTFVQNVANVLATAIVRTKREDELLRNKRAMDEAPVGITITDPDREDNPITYANQEFQELTGYSESEILGRNCRFLQGEATDPEAVAKIREAIDDESHITTEIRNYRKDGTEFWNQLSISPVYDDDGAVVNYVGFQQDVTADRRQRERRKLQRETIVELATDDAVTTGDFGAALHRITETAGRVLDVPRVNIWLLGEGESGKLTCVDNYERASGEHTRGGKLDPDEHPVYLETLRQNQVVDVPDVFEDDRVAELRDDYLDVHDIGALLDGTLRSEGEVIGVVCHEHVGGPREWTDDELDFVSHIADILHRSLRNRERRKRKQQLERTNALISTLFETLPVGVLAEDASRNVLAVNSRFFELFGISASPEEMVGADCEQLAEEASELFDDPEAFPVRVDEIVDRQESVHNEPIPLRDGRTFTRSHEPIELPEGAGHLWVYRDTTGVD